MATVILTQTASWNKSLRNGYRTRYTEFEGRYFRVSVDSLNSVYWDIDLISADGKLLGYVGLARGLAVARTKIAAAQFETTNF